jgi:hypothetical protein
MVHQRALTFVPEVLGLKINLEPQYGQRTFFLMYVSATILLQEKHL